MGGGVGVEKQIMMLVITLWGFDRKPSSERAKASGGDICNLSASRRG